MMPVFTKGEEEFYYNRAELKFKYEISNPYTLDSKSVAIEYAVEHEGVVIVVERSKIEKIMKKIASAREDIQKKSN
ncbi:hypothetical protein AKO1_002304 [Acrasis kona]|uniref:Uncharacterized protein n=1 Tax=Acrasis kona TaxID=1008807 RepID=A0AAW2ZMW0_9EUKA